MFVTTLLSGRSGVQITSGTPKIPPENPVKSRVSVHKDVFSYEKLVATSVMEAAAFSLSAVDHGLDDSAIASISFMLSALPIRPSASTARICRSKWSSPAFSS